MDKKFSILILAGWVWLSQKGKLLPHIRYWIVKVC
ncbi:hypothetical protein PRO82_002080 [Candidatus Protochlamydia amoebophila]|nr:hypothetical protein [Candidatus Protochlamydia amoebophila]